MAVLMNEKMSDATPESDEVDILSAESISNGAIEARSHVTDSLGAIALCQGRTRLEAEAETLDQFGHHV